MRRLALTCPHVRLSKNKIFFGYVGQRQKSSQEMPSDNIFTINVLPK